MYAVTALGPITVLFLELPLQLLDFQTHTTHKLETFSISADSLVEVDYLLLVGCNGNFLLFEFLFHAFNFAKVMKGVSTELSTGLFLMIKGRLFSFSGQALIALVKVYAFFLVSF